MARVKLSGLTKVYPSGQVGVSDLDLDVADGEFLVLVGPSGCGKSTALRMIAGLEDISGGELQIGDQVVNDLPPKERDIAMVFQNYALYPHMTVRQNVAFALKLSGTPKDEIAKRVAEVAKVLQLDEWLDRKPGQLSGGQRQRVAMGRAIVRDPAVFLMDEPLSNLDAKLRVQMRAEIARLQRELKTTTIYVTHDQVEAMTMGDRVAVLREGQLQQVDTPQKLYDVPENVFVAAFIGSPSMNLLEATIVQTSSDLSVVIGDQALSVPQSVRNERPDLDRFVDKRVIVGIRPEIFFDQALGAAASEGQRMRVNIELLESLGSEIILHMRIPGQLADTEDTRKAQADNIEDAVLVAAARNEGEQVAIVARVDPRSNLKAGDVAELGIDTHRLHFFDPETSKGIH